MLSRRQIAFSPLLRVLLCTASDRQPRYNKEQVQLHKMSFLFRSSSALQYPGKTKGRSPCPVGGENNLRTSGVGKCRRLRRQYHKKRSSFWTFGPITHLMRTRKSRCTIVIFTAQAVIITFYFLPSPCRGGTWEISNLPLSSSQSVSGTGNGHTSR